MKTISVNDLEKNILELNRAKNKLSKIEKLLLRAPYINNNNIISIEDSIHEILTNTTLQLDGEDLKNVLRFLATTYKVRIDNIEKELKGNTIE